MGDRTQPPTLKKAWVTLLTRPSYLPGAVLLAYSLRRFQSAYPLLILYTPTTLPSCFLASLSKECTLTNAQLIPIEPLTPIDGKMTLIAGRFEDPWTKLRVFSLVSYSHLVFLDADMLVHQNMDELFSFPLPAKNWIAANHACVCNLDKDSWAPADWNASNCAYTGLVHPTALSHPCPVPAPGKGGKRTQTLLNSGMFILQPHQELWEEMMGFWDGNQESLREYMFPDQDFLADFFKGRWVSVGWQYNALKTMRYWHADMFRDVEVRNLHYIVDKPWSKRISSDGVAGYLGKDGVTHGWWWREYERWEQEREINSEHEILEMMRANMAPPLQEEGGSRHVYEAK